MKFTVDNKTYFVKWEYDGHDTLCHIYDTSTSYQNTLVTATAFLSPGDRFCKNTGRKISLGRALEKLFPDHKNYLARETAWQEYFNESPKRLR